MHPVILGDVIREINCLTRRLHTTKKPEKIAATLKRIDTLKEARNAHLAEAAEDAR